MYPETLHSPIYLILYRPMGENNKAGEKETYSFFQVLLVWVIIWRVPQDFSKEQRVFYQAAPWNIEEIP